MLKFVTAIVIFPIMAVSAGFAESGKYLWTNNYDSTHSICNLIDPPDGFRRINTEPGTFAHWLRHLPVRSNQKHIYNYKGEKVESPDASFAIIDIDIGNKDLLQCADAIIRFRAEYLYFNKLLDSIVFNFTSGHELKFIDWLNGIRPVVNENKVSFTQLNSVDSSYESFREYLDTVFMYAGTHSLSNQLKKIESIDSIKIGDMFIFPGFPGHAVLVTDMATDTLNNRKVFLFTQGFMPAQDVHVVKNPRMSNNAPWFELKAGDTLEILHWKFTENHLRRF